MLAALGFGVKGIIYHMYHDDPILTGFEHLPGLLAEIKKVNADLRELMPFFAAALPLSTVTVGERTTGVRISTLWSGEAVALVLVVRNLDYTTDHHPNELGLWPRFQSHPKEMVHVVVPCPPWLTTPVAMDALTKQPVLCPILWDTIQLDVGPLELGKVIVIQNAK